MSNIKTAYFCKDCGAPVKAPLEGALDAQPEFDIQAALRDYASRVAPEGGAPTVEQLNGWLSEWSGDNDNDDELFTEEEWCRTLAQFLWAKMATLRVARVTPGEGTP